MSFQFHRISGGIILIAVGVLIWLSNLGIIHVWWRRDWPVLLIVIGVLALIKTIIRRRA
jgi:hypothetical protein